MKPGALFKKIYSKEMVRGLIVWDAVIIHKKTAQLRVVEAPAAAPGVWFITSRYFKNWELVGGLCVAFLLSACCGEVEYSKPTIVGSVDGCTTYKYSCRFCDPVFFTRCEHTNGINHVETDWTKDEYNGKVHRKIPKKMITN